MALSKRAQLTVLFVCFLPPTLGCTVYGLRYVRRVAQLREGTSAVPAQVLSTRLETLPCSGTCKSGPSYRPRVAYRYEVQGSVYHGERVTSLNETGSASWAADVLERYRAGANTTVHYDLAHPEQAWLEDSATWPYWVLATVPVTVVLLFGALITVLARRRTTEEPASPPEARA